MEFLDCILLFSDWTRPVNLFRPDLKWPISYELFISDQQEGYVTMYGWNVAGRDWQVNP